jgi:hypothetical protein
MGNEHGKVGGFPNPTLYPPFEEQMFYTSSALTSFASAKAQITERHAIQLKLVGRLMCKKMRSDTL